MNLFQPAVKEQLRGRVAIDGPTGSGKTWTALQWARILAGPDGPVGLIDTENRSAAYYAAAPGSDVDRVNYWDPPYEFGHLPVSPPYDPRELRTLIDAAGRDENLGENGVLIIDSLTHYWTGEGGTLDIVDDAAQRSGNSFVGWTEGTPAQRMMLDAIVQARCHVIVTMRSKMAYVLEEETRGGKKRSIPKKVGMAPEQRAGIEYEFTVVADMDLDHRLIVSKSRCDVIADKVAPHGKSADVGQAFADWLGSGVAKITADEAAELIEMMGRPKVADERKALKSRFLKQFRHPTQLNSEELPAAVEWITSALAALDDNEDGS